MTELRAFVEDSRSHVNTSGLRRDARSGVRTSVAILIELVGWVDGGDAVCGGVSVGWGGEAEEGGGGVEQDWGD